MAKGRMSSLEDRLTELEAITQKLEDGQLTIDEAIEAYTKGMEIALSCKNSLDEMTQKIEVVRRKTEAMLASADSQADPKEEMPAEDGNLPF